MSTTTTATTYTFHLDCTTLSAKSAPPTAASGVREQRWFYAHEAEMIAEYGGRWIAVAGDTVVGAGNGALEAHEQAKSRGFADAALIPVPNILGEWDNLI